MGRPALFVGSSSEGLRIAEAVQVVLDPVCEVELWTQGIFGLMQGTLESLVMALARFDFALLVLTADDLTVSRGTEKATARDNVLFELGLFIGSLGRDRTFTVYDRTNPPALPSDLAGITAATFAPHTSGNLEAALGAPCAKIRSAVERLGVRKDKGLQDLEKATLNVEGVGATMQSLLRLLARSRKVELDIIATQFGPMIGSQQLQQMKRDLADLEKTLGED
jgi:CAP12/Pycsar effector protein, TIR domain